MITKVQENYVPELLNMFSNTIPKDRINHLITKCQSQFSMGKKQLKKQNRISQRDQAKIRTRLLGTYRFWKSRLDNGDTILCRYFFEYNKQDRILTV